MIQTLTPVRFLLAVIVTGLLALMANSISAQQQESFEGFANGIRANAVKGEVFYEHEDGKFALEPGHKLEAGFFTKSGANSYAELLLQPGNYLRIGPDSECQ